VTAAAKYHQVSWPIAHAAFVAHVTPTLAQPPPSVEVLGIDETRRGRPRWASHKQDLDTQRWSIVHDRWHTAIVDAAGSAGLLAHVDGRTAAAVADWVAAQPDSWKQAVTHVCIDLSASYAKAVHDALPDAVVVADRFHLVKLGNDMVTEVRQRTTREGRGRRGTTRDPEWANRRRLLTAHERLSSYSFARMWNALLDEDDVGVQVLRAYIVKEELRALLALAGTNPDRELISHRLWTFYSSAAGHRGRHSHRLLQCSFGGLQPPRETRRPQRLRLPQCREPTPPDTLDLHPPTPTGVSYDHRVARLTSKSLFTQTRRPSNSCEPPTSEESSGFDYFLGARTRKSREILSTTKRKSLVEKGISGLA